MAAQTRTTLKTYFNTGDTPTETQFANLIDSFHNTTDDGTALTDVTGEAIGSLSDVVVTGTPADNEVLAYDSGGNWINQTAAEAGLAAATHTHVEADITDLGTYLTDITGESVGDLSDVTITTGAQGDILYNNGSAWVNLAPGTSGQYLQTQGAAANPQWATLSGGGDMAAATYDPATISEQLVGLTATQTLTNKTIDADNNTISNIALGAEATGAINDLSDVTITTPADNEVLAYDGVSDFINQTPAEAGLQGVLSEGAFVDGDKTKLDGIETAADVTDATNVAAAGALMSGTATLDSLSAVDTDKSKTPADGDVLTFDGTDWNAEASAAGMTNPMTTAGDLIYGGASGAPTRLAAGTEGYVLTMGATDPTWAAAAGGSGGPRGFTYVIAASDSRDNTGADATCDGTADDVEIQAGIDAVATAGGGTVMLLDGTYEIDTSITLKSYVNLVGQGRGTQLTRSDSTVFFTNGAQVDSMKISDMRIDGNEQTGEAINNPTGVFVSCTFENLWVDDFTGGKFINTETKTNYCGFKNIHLNNCDAFGSVYNQNVLDAIYFNMATQTAASSSVPFELSGLGNIMTNCHIDASNVVSTTYGVISANTESKINNCHFSDLASNTDGITVNGDYCTIEGNTFKDCDTGGDIIQVNNGSYCIINGNVIENGTVTSGYAITDGSNEAHNIYSNNIIQTTAYGMNIQAAHSSVSGNTVYCTGDYGLLIRGDYQNVTGNTIKMVGGTDVALNLSDNMEGTVITGNTILTGTIYHAQPRLDSSHYIVLANNRFQVTDHAGNERGCYEYIVEEFVNEIGTAVDGQVVVRSIDTGNGWQGAGTTTTAGDPTVLGVCISGGTGDVIRVVRRGAVATLKVDGTDDIAIGDPLSTFTSAGIAQKAASGETVFAYALEAYTTDDSNGVIDAIVVEPYTLP